SFLFTWQIDQDKIYGQWDEYFSAGVSVNNWLGKLGALTSHFFIHRWFGISSFLFSFLFFLIGTRLLFKIKLLPITTTLKYSFFILVWVSVALGYLLGESYFYLGGGFGYSVNLWLSSIIGNIGVVFLLLFSLTLFFII